MDDCIEEEHKQIKGHDISLTLLFMQHDLIGTHAISHVMDSRQTQECAVVNVMALMCSSVEMFQYLHIVLMAKRRKECTTDIYITSSNDGESINQHVF